MSQCMLVCAVVASLAVGVWLAQGLCMAMFAIFRIHSLQVAAARVATPQAKASPVRAIS